MAQVNVSINGRAFRLACDDGQEEHVASLGARFDQAITELRGALGEIGDQRLMVMAGILMTDRLREAEARLRGAEDEIEAMRERRREVQGRYEALEEGFVSTLENTAERIETLADRLHQIGRTSPSGIEP
ncbi:cell division protein ZapA [Faunimonas pinastri]|uniref:Cell division protein ZapA n=1 Tax=Faunimonas pinastri TaxID=1855383 RepID=A0A1H8Z4P5_9HYPH|nr:cell division protein ZapA [Faunimonas pinastri]SEP59332.1 cell division protein ZapA [Faunimonas pinastri]